MKGIKKMSSIRKVAELAGVSLGSVSRYLNGHQLKEQNMKKIAAAIEELDYKENIIAKGLKNNRSFSVGLLMNSISSQFGAEIVSAIEEIMEQNGYSVLLSGFKGDVSLVDQKIDYLVQHAVDGLIVFMSEQDWDGMERLAELPIPVLTINSPVRLPGVDRVQVADRKNVAEVVEYLIQEGHTKIGLLAAPQNDYVARERLLGAKQAVSQYPGVELMIEYGDYSRLSGYWGGKSLIDQDVTALIVTNFNMMTGVLEYSQHSEKNNLVVAHYDYTSEMAELLNDRIVLKAPTQLIGQRAAQMLLERMNEDTSAEKDEIIDNEIFGM